MKAKYGIVATVKFAFIKFANVVLAVAMSAAAADAQAQERLPEAGEFYPLGQAEIAVRDPFVAVDHAAGKYYIIATASDGETLALKAYESPDLDHWRDMGLVFRGDGPWFNETGIYSDHWWAPDTYFIDGRYHTIFTLTNNHRQRANFCTVISAPTPTGPYSPVLKDGEPVSLTPEGEQCLDGSVFVDSEGTPWLVYSLEWNGAQARDKVGEVWARPLRKDLTDSAGDAICLFRASEAPWPYYAEGLPVDAPFIFRDDESGNLICLWSSFQGQTYCVGQAVSETGDIRGPWTHETVPVYVNGGHQMVFRDLDGNLKMSLHHNNDDAHLRIVPLEIAAGRVKPMD